MNDAEYIPISDSDSDLSPDEQDEFKDLKNLEDENKQPLKTGDVTFGEDSDNCSICFEPWTSTGPHKLCCLRCGHLFGYSCISKWIRSQGKQGRCPQCNSNAVRRDIRFLYTKNLRVLDTSERDRALADLAIERTLRRKAELEAAEHKAKYQLLHVELTQLREEFQSVRAVSQAFVRHSDPPDSSSQSVDSAPSGARRGQYELVKSLPLSNTGNCRVMASCDYLNVLCVSQPSTNPIFRGFGIRKINTVEQRPLKYIHLHCQPVRDLAFHSNAQDGLLISASLDKSVRLTSLLTDQVVQTYQCPSPVWSCCWASPDPHRLFAGCSNGSVLVFDIRFTSGPVATLTVPENTSPVIGLQYVPRCGDGSRPTAGGLLVGQLTKITFMAEASNGPSLTRMPSETVATEETTAHAGDLSPMMEADRQSPDLFGANSNPPVIHSFQAVTDYSPHSLPLEGSLVSLCLAPESRQFLASYRPSQRLPRVRHLLAELVSENHSLEMATVAEHCTYTCRELHSLWAGPRMKMLTRTRLFNGSGGMTAVAGCEDVGGAIVWRCDTGTRLQTLHPPDATTENPVIDVCPFATTGSDQFNLALLTERTVHFYRWTPISL
ncbi:Ring finger and WD repeat domain 3 [Paragonimus heterotremus]|uniref:RING-type E3 ubiquitin transferase n=1 Tax=Paragonimus heterotremus TaxID=100268 RepID=A0A8J4STR2_9TREM|nr:Ring finger and WD repeat domain 3 [Paragonimus heterotremus]